VIGPLYQRVPVALEARPDDRIIRRSRIVACQDDDIEICKVRPGGAKAFPDKAFQSISIDRAPHSLLRDRETQARIPQTVCTVEHCKQPVSGTPAVAEDTIVVRGGQQPTVTAEFARAIRHDAGRRPDASHNSHEQLSLSLRHGEKVSIAARLVTARVRSAGETEKMISS